MAQQPLSSRFRAEGRLWNRLLERPVANSGAVITHNALLAAVQDPDPQEPAVVIVRYPEAMQTA